MSFTQGRRGARMFILGLMLLALGGLVATQARADLGVRIVGVETGDFGNGRIDHVKVSFNVAMTTNAANIQKSSGPGEPGFQVAGYTIDRFEWIAAQGTPNTTLLVHLIEKPDPDTAARPEVTYRSGGGATSSLGSDAEDFSGPAADKAGPVLLRFDANDQSVVNMFNNTADEAWLTFSEPATLVGATPRDRWIALEKAVKFVNEPGKTTCQDGTGSVSDQTGGIWNFPQPNANVPGQDAIIAPATGASATVFHVKQGATMASGRQFVATPQLCYTGIDTAVGAAASILDAAGNGASPLSALQNRRVYINPVDATLLSADTLDANADGAIDGITLTFNQKIDDTTFENVLGSLVVTNGSAVATVDPTLDTGTTPNDSTLSVRLTDVSWAGSVRPSIAYDKPAGCTSTSGTPGAKAIVPTGGTWRACVASFSVTAADKARPVILSAATADVAGGKANGRIDRLDLTFSESVSTPTAAGWTVDGAAATAALNGSDPRIVHLTFTEGSTPNSGAKPAYAYASQTAGGGAGTVDLGANQPTAGTRVATLDKARPVITGASQFDRNEDGSIDRLEVTYSEQIVEPDVSALTGFSLGGNAATGFATPAPGDVADDSLVSIAVAPVTGTEKKSVSYTPAAATIADAAGNTAATETVSPALVKDLAAPHAVIGVSPSAPLTVGTSTITATYSEQMSSASSPTATFAGNPITGITDASHTNGWKVDDATIWQGTVAVSESDCGNPTGCEVQIQVADATDLASPANTQVAALKDTEVDTIAPQVPVITGMRTTVPAGESVAADTLNMFSTDLTLDATIAADAGSGRAFMVVNGTEIGLDDTIAESGTTVSPTAIFADLASLQSAFSEGAHDVALTVCDDAANCSTSVATHGITVDTTPIAIEASGPAAGSVVAGGTPAELTWSAADDADFDHVELDYAYGSNGGAIDHAITDRSGSKSWTTPSIESADVTVAATSVDASGNKAVGASQAFIVDSNAPVVNLQSLPTFLSAGKPVTVRWTATDASLGEVTNPIAIQYSNDNGTTWKSINAGTYSGANDGSETWNVPSTTDLETRVRVVATDATSKIGTDVSGRLARGVSGYLAQHGGKVYAFGSATRTTNESVTSTSDWVRGIAMRSSGVSGYTLSSTGRLYPFSVGTVAIPKRPTTSTFRGDDARGVVLRTDSSGYVLRETGQLYAFGGAPKARTSKTWTCDCARSVVLLANGRGGYVLDAYGRMHPFAVGSYAMPAQIQSKQLSSTKRYVDLVLRSNGRSGYFLETSGNVRAFGGAPSVGEAGDGASKKAVALIKVTDSAGYWVDYRGTMYAYGSAFGSPSLYTFTGSTIRGASAN